jgi:hypothetical protein
MDRLRRSTVVQHGGPRDRKEIDPRVCNNTSEAHKTMHRLVNMFGLIRERTEQKEMEDMKNNKKLFFQPPTNICTASL